MQIYIGVADFIFLKFWDTPLEDTSSILLLSTLSLRKNITSLLPYYPSSKRPHSTSFHHETLPISHLGLHNLLAFIPKDVSTAAVFSKLKSKRRIMIFHQIYESTRSAFHQISSPFRDMTPHRASVNTYTYIIGM